MKSIDADGSGVIDYTEFLATCLSKWSDRLRTVSNRRTYDCLDIQAATLDRKHYMEDGTNYCSACYVIMHRNVGFR